MSSYNRSYRIVNIALIAIFSLAILYFFFSAETAQCYYQKNYGFPCRTCGITRDFRSILRLEFKNLINPHSVSYFGAFGTLFFSRFSTLYLLWKNVPFKKIAIFDIAISTAVVLVLIIL